MIFFVKIDVHRPLDVCVSYCWNRVVGVMGTHASLVKHLNMQFAISWYTIVSTWHRLVSLVSPTFSHWDRIATLLVVSVCSVRHVTGLWARPVIRSPVVPIDRQHEVVHWGLGSGFQHEVVHWGLPLHRVEPVFPPVSRFSKWQGYRSHRTKSVGLYHLTCLTWWWKTTN